MTQIGGVLVVHDSPECGDTVREFAVGLRIDPGRVNVVVDHAAELTPERGVRLCALLADRGPIRLLVPYAASEPTGLGQWLADRLRVEVVAPVGQLRTARCGTQLAAWIGLLPDRSPRVEAHRHPAPPWDNQVPGTPLRVGPGSVAEPIAAGFWLRPAESLVPPAWEAAVTGMPVRSDAVCLVVGVAGGLPVSADDVIGVAQRLHGDNNAIRLIQVGEVSGLDGALLGQRVADGMGAPLRAQQGIPVSEASGVPYCVNVDGEYTWAPPAEEILYRPAAAHAVTRCHPPAPGLRHVGGGMFAWNDKIVVEVVQSGLWVRDADTAPAVGSPRERAFNPERCMLYVGSGQTGVTSPLAAAAADLALVVHASIRPFLQTAYLSDPGTGRSATQQVYWAEGSSGAEASAHDTTTRTTGTPDVDVEQAGGGELAGTPLTAAAALTGQDGRPEGQGQAPPRAGHRSSVDERRWLRATLGAQEERFASLVRRMIADNPGLLPAGEEDHEAAVTDLVAVCVYLSATDTRIDELFRAGDLGALRAYGACLMSGLDRLPTHRGTVFCTGFPEADALPDDAPANLRVATASPLVGFLLAEDVPESPARVVMHCRTARRPGTLDPAHREGVMRVLVSAGTEFVLRDIEPTADGRVVHLVEQVGG
ncbi:hypothetical protein [Micromonospora sp. NBC_01412]|uniref:hypothetical protein n=1 Tax=Micromonospora sp. NBC_01412 TaxID=2903590 RepID=UPI00324758D7